MTVPHPPSGARRLYFLWRGALAAALALAACGPPEPQASRRDTAGGEFSLPPARTFGPTAPMRPTRPNAEMAEDFLDLVFRMESGRSVPALSRFEGPVTLTVSGAMPPFADEDLSRLVARLRSEAGIDISRTSGPGASITVEFLPRRTMQALVPMAACFVAPNVSSWSEYRRARNTDATDWTKLATRTRVAVFIPNDVAPQEVRDCMNEEIAQGLGPLNDLYRLPDSVFNDDNIHGVLTGFDMLMLRAYYAPSLRSGMTEAEAAAVVPGLIAALNPGGGGPGYSGAERDTPRTYITAIETALGPRTGREGRKSAAHRAIEVSESRGWRDTRAGFAWFVMGRLELADRPDQALDAFLRADAIYRSRSVTELQDANVGLQIAAFALSQGDAEAAIARADAATGAAIAGQNAALLATLLLIKAEALDILGRRDEAAAVRGDGLSWARYGFGSADEVRDRFRNIVSLSPARRVAGAGGTGQ